MIRNIPNIYLSICKFLEKYPLGVFTLFTRIYIAWIFLKSGWLKINDWETTLMLFEYEHPPILREEVVSLLGLSGEIQILPIKMAAYLGTFSEIFFSILLILGFLGRLGAFGLIIVTIIIQLTYLDATEHYYWLMILGFFLFQGAGRFSIDAIVRNNFFDTKK